MNKYEVLGITGEGQYGVVLKARHKESGALVAVKKFKDSEEDDLVRKTTMREVKLLRLLRHPNVVELREAFRRRGRLYLVFEFVERNLLEVLEASDGGLAPRQVKLLIAQLLFAIEFCHAHCVVHRDIKPENLLVNDGYSLRLCDFGFARTAKPGCQSLTDYVATRWYRAPELLLGTSDYTPAVDLFAVACIMAEMTDGEPLFPGENELEQLQLIHEQIGPLTGAQLARLARNPRLRSLKLKAKHKPRRDVLGDRYLHKVGRRGVDVLRGLLKVDPAERLTAAQALAMPFFDGIREAIAYKPVPQIAFSSTRKRSSSKARKEKAKKRNANRPSPAKAAASPRGGKNAGEGVAGAGEAKEEDDADEAAAGSGAAAPLQPQPPVAQPAQQQGAVAPAEAEAAAPPHPFVATLGASQGASAAQFAARQQQAFAAAPMFPGGAGYFPVGGYPNPNPSVSGEAPHHPLPGGDDESRRRKPVPPSRETELDRLLASVQGAWAAGPD